MKLGLVICIVLVLINGLTAFWLTDIVTSLVRHLFGPVKKATFGLVHTACHVFADTVRKHSLNPPDIDEVYLQLRSPCQRISFKVNESEKFLNISEFSNSQITVVLVLGWLGSLDDGHVEDMARAYHCRGGYNFMVLAVEDYLLTDYLNSAYHSEKLGEFLAIGLEKLNGTTLHLIGHSLGAHVVGSAGRYFYNRTAMKVQRITGLDPAAPCFVTPVVFPRLGPDDATSVDVIHSNPNEFGTAERLGTADFYVGGFGDYQSRFYPGNEDFYMGTCCESEWDLKQKMCNGPQYPMGFAANGSMTGVFYVDIRDRPPYDNFVEADSCGYCDK